MTDPAVSLLLQHLLETTVERDAARAQVQKMIGENTELEGTVKELLSVRAELATLKEATS